MGISTAIGTVLESVAGSVFGAGGLLGVAGTAIGAGAIEGAALGGGISALEGKNIGKGALLGGLTGGIGGGATSALEGAGVGTLAADGIGGLIGGAGAGLITGENPKQALKTGLISGGLSLAEGYLSGQGAGKAPSTGGGSSSAASTAAPASVGAVDPNVTAPAGSSLPGSGGGGSGLPGSFGTGAAGETGSAALGQESSFGGAPPTSGATTSVAPSAPSVSGTGGDVVITGNPLSVNTKIPGIDSLGPILAPKSANDNSGKSKLNTLLHSPGALLAGGALGANLLAGNKKPIGFSALEGQAQQELTQSRQLEGYMGNGTLPPGLQTGIDSATASAAATIRSQYAARGMSGSSAEAQDLAALNQRATTQGAQIAMQLFQQGVSEAGLSDQIYAQLMQVQQQEDQETTGLIGQFATALGGLGRGTGTNG